MDVLRSWAVPALVVLAAAAPTTYYEAKVASFGCNSIHEVHELMSVRSDPKAFPMALLTKQVEGQCVAIQQGTKVEGAIEESDKSILRVNGEIDPPGYEAPIDDFVVSAPPKDASRPAGAFE